MSTLLYIDHVDSQAQPSISLVIWPEVKRVGMTGYLNCTVSRQNNNKVSWIRKWDNLALTSDDRVQVDSIINEKVDGFPKFDIIKAVNGDKTVYTLVVRRLVLSDGGNYTCQVIMTGSSIYPSKDGIIYVLVPPAIEHSLTTQTVMIAEGGNVNLTCAASGYPTPNISWVRVNGDPLPPPYNVYVFKSSIISLYDIKAVHRGMYRCVADNNVRPLATYDATVYIYSKPISRPIQSSYGQAANRQFDLTIDCIVSGYPAPNMNWYKVENNIMRPIIEDDWHVVNQMLSHGQQLSITDVWYQLTIINVRANDYGTYVCVGTNRYGSSQYNISVFETSECQGPNCPNEGGTARSKSPPSNNQTIFINIFMYLLAAAIYSNICF